MKRYRVCTTRGCTNLVTRTEPCSKHSRPVNSPWSKDRDTKAHLAQRRALIKQRGPSCQRCGWTTTKDGKGLQMHHTGPRGDDVVLLCRGCHRAVDAHAR